MTFSRQFETRAARAGRAARAPRPARDHGGDVRKAPGLQSRGFQSRGFPSRRFHCTFATLLVASLALMCAPGCGDEAGARGGTDERKQEAIAVTVTPAIVAPVQRSVEVTGTLFGDEEATVSAKVPGRIVAILRDV